MAADETRISSEQLGVPLRRWAAACCCGAKDRNCTDQSGGGNLGTDVVTRTIRDGDRVRAEIRAPLATAAEQDTGLVPLGTAWPRKYGRVVYLHGRRWTTRWRLRA